MACENCYAYITICLVSAIIGIYLIRKYSHKSLRDISKLFNISIVSVSNMIKQLENNNKINLEEIEEEIISELT